jgi:hypothetical protein
MFNMRPQTDPRMQAFLEDEKRLREQEAMGGSMLGAGTRGQAQPDMRAAAAPMGPGGMAAPGAQRPGVPPHTAAPPVGPPPFAQGAQGVVAGGALPPPAAAAGAAQMAAGSGAGALAGMAPIAAVGLQALDKYQKEREAKQAAREGIQQQYAASLGGNMAPVAAARANRDASNIEGENYLEKLLPFLRGFG